MAIDIIFASVTATDQADYVSQKLRDFFENGHAALGASQDGALTDEKLRELTAVVCDGLVGGNGSVPLAAESDFPTFTARQQEVVNLRSECFINEVNALSPLLATEQLESGGDFVTYLLEDFRSYAAGTPVLRRKTNMATLYYPATHIQVAQNGDVSELARTAPDIPPDEAALGQLAASPMAAAAMPTSTGVVSDAENIAKGLVWALPPPYSAIGATLLNLLFPGTGNGIDWTTVFQQFSDIVLNADTETTINTQDGLLNGVLSDINDYMNIQGEKTKGERSNLLNSYLNRANNIVGVLQQQQFEKKGLATYMHAAGIELAILQEMAKQDPNVIDPLQSGYVKTISQNAKAYAAHATSILDKIITNLVTERGNQITQATFGDHCGGGLPPTCSTWYYFKDNQTNYKKEFTKQGKKDSPQTDCQNARNTYFNNVTSQYQAKLRGQSQWIISSINWWQKLVNNPLPQQPSSGS
ncbi:MAG TPA: hypothetical protein VJT09_04720 [Pyrinomonadaceae bacterium]|nr:hypothetical protein [Pyrinomonadaceae bacterium]